MLIGDFASRGGQMDNQPGQDARGRSIPPTTGSTQPSTPGTYAPSTMDNDGVAPSGTPGYKWLVPVAMVVIPYVLTEEILQLEDFDQLKSEPIDQFDILNYDYM